MITIVVNVSLVTPVIMDAAPNKAKIPGLTSKLGLINSNINSAYSLPTAAPNTIHGTKNPIGILNPCVKSININIMTEYMSKFITPNIDWL